MPLYDFRCLSCDHEFEARQSFSAPPQAFCPRCEGISRRKFNAVPVIYKGSGFYTTDYKRGNSVAAQSHKSEEEAEKGEAAKA